MFGTGANPFDPAKFADMFKTMDVTKMFDPSAFKGFDQSALFAAQQKNMDAMITAQKTAAAGYQDLFEKQVEIFQETMKAAQAQISELSKSEPGAAAASRQAELTSKAFETAVANAKDLAEAAQKANADAYEIVKARIDASVKELKSGLK